MNKQIAYSGKDNNFRNLLVNILKSSSYKTVVFENIDIMAVTVLRNPDLYEAVLVDMFDLEFLPPEVSSITALVPVIMLCSGATDLISPRAEHEPFKLGRPISVLKLMRLLQLVGQQKDPGSASEGIEAKTAMVVDDCPSIRLFVREILKSVGYKVTEAPNGLEALRILDKPDCPEFSIFIVDLEMPEIDGPTLIKELNKRFEDPLVIITTGTKDIELLKWAKTTGLACGLIEKPFSSKSFIRLISTYS
jgi:DNA-binding NtrC family response regulator